MFDPAEDEDRFVRLRDEERVFGVEVACTAETAESGSLLGRPVRSALQAWSCSYYAGVRLVDRWWPCATDAVWAWEPQATVAGV